LSWCDRLASVPTAGFKLDPHFAPQAAIITSLAPVLDREYKDEKAQFQIAQEQTAFGASFTTNEGYNYDIDPVKIAVGFRHRMRARPVSGGPPIMEMLSRPLPYTELLPSVIRKLIEATLLLPRAKTRSVTRVGIVSTTSVADEELPPGIARFIKYMGRPWKGEIDHYNISITSDIGKGQGWTDRCIHQVNKPDDREQLMTLNFDWQRVFTSGHPISTASLSDILEKAERAALKYFEDLAEGRRFDEDLIREAARV
jgi:hypothetical protein